MAPEDLRMPVPMPADLPSLSAYVEQAEANERQFMELAPLYGGTLGSADALAKKYAPRSYEGQMKRLFLRWKALQEQIADTMRLQTDGIKQAAAVVDTVQRAYEQVYGQLVEAAERQNISFGPEHEALRNALIAYQVVASERNGLSERVKRLEAQQPVALTQKVSELQKRLNEERASTRMLLTRAAMLFVVPAATAVLVWACGLL